MKMKKIDFENHRKELYRYALNLSKTCSDGSYVYHHDRADDLIQELYLVYYNLKEKNKLFGILNIEAYLKSYLYYLFIKSTNEKHIKYEKKVESYTNKMHSISYIDRTWVFDDYVNQLKKSKWTKYNGNTTVYNKVLDCLVLGYTKLEISKELKIGKTQVVRIVNKIKSRVSL